MQLPENDPEAEKTARIMAHWRADAASQMTFGEPGNQTFTFAYNRTFEAVYITLMRGLDRTRVLPELEQALIDKFGDEYLAKKAGKILLAAIDKVRLKDGSEKQSLHDDIARSAEKAKADANGAEFELALGKNLIVAIKGWPMRVHTRTKEGRVVLAFIAHPRGIDPPEFSPGEHVDLEQGHFRWTDGEVKDKDGTPTTRVLRETPDLAEKAGEFIIATGGRGKLQIRPARTTRVLWG